MKKELLIFSVLVLSLAFFTASCGSESNQKNSTQTTTLASSGETQRLNMEVQRLNSELTRIMCENTDLRNQLNDCLNKSSYTTTTRKTTAPNPKKKEVPIKNSQPSVEKKQIVEQPQPQKAINNTPNNANTDALRENGVITFCVMANKNGGLHFPQKAIQMGVKFKSLQENSTNDGSNFIVEPMIYVDGDYGLLDNGTFFISNKLIKDVLDKAGITLTTLDIKAPCTGWQPKSMTLLDGYWLYKAL